MQPCQGCARRARSYERGWWRTGRWANEARGQVWTSVQIRHYENTNVLLNQYHHRIVGTGEGGTFASREYAREESEREKERERRRGRARPMALPRCYRGVIREIEGQDRMPGGLVQPGVGVWRLPEEWFRYARSAFVAAPVTLNHDDGVALRNGTSTASLSTRLQEDGERCKCAWRDIRREEKRCFLSRCAIKNIYDYFPLLGTLVVVCDKSQK